MCRCDMCCRQLRSGRCRRSGRWRRASSSLTRRTAAAAVRLVALDTATTPRTMRIARPRCSTSSSSGAHVLIRTRLCGSFRPTEAWWRREFDFRLCCGWEPGATPTWTFSFFLFVLSFFLSFVLLTLAWFPSFCASLFPPPLVNLFLCCALLCPCLFALRFVCYLMWTCFCARMLPVSLVCVSISESVTHTTGECATFVSNLLVCLASLPTHTGCCFVCLCFPSCCKCEQYLLASLIAPVPPSLPLPLPLVVAVRAISVLCTKGVITATTTVKLRNRNKKGHQQEGKVGGQKDDAKAKVCKAAMMNP